MQWHLKIIGVLLIILAAIHVAFPKYFNWKEELKPLTIINRQLMYVHSFLVAFAILLIGILCLTSSNDLVETTFGKRICLGLGLFWAARLMIQFFGYSSKLWRGKTFETSIHIIFSLFWIYLCVIFILIYIT
jgi:hypothetical protein